MSEGLTLPPPLEAPRPPTSTLFPYTTLFRSAKMAMTPKSLPVSGLLTMAEKVKAGTNRYINKDERTRVSMGRSRCKAYPEAMRSEEHTSELQSRPHLVCRLLLERKKEGRSG